MGAMASPLTGASGNVEFLLHARKSGGGAVGAVGAGEVASLMAGAVSEAEGHLSAADPAG
jgi:hypothetical protein